MKTTINIDERLDIIEKEIKNIKKDFVRKDDIMNYDEFEAYKRSLNEDNLVDIELVKKNLGIWNAIKTFYRKTSYKSY